MVLFPRIGGRYWIVTDFYETFVAIPVTLVRKGGLFNYTDGSKGLYTVEFWLAPPVPEEGDPGYCEEYDGYRRDLYHTERQAGKVADRLNREIEALREKGEL